MRQAGDDDAGDAGDAGHRCSKADMPQLVNTGVTVTT